VDAINRDAQNFYEGFGFTLLSNNSHRMFLAIKSI
jgi:hypothetical protein